MSVVRARKNHKLVRNLGLLASASIMSMMMAGEAQAACVVSSSDPLINITSQFTTVACSGVNNAQTINVNTNDTAVFVGGTLDNSAVTLNGNSNYLQVSSGSTSAQLIFSTGGVNNDLLIDGNVTIQSAVVNGAQSDIRIFNGGSVTAAPGSMTLSAPTGQFNTFNLAQGGSLTSTGNVAGAYLLTGGTGTQFFGISGTVALQSNGLFIDAGDGDDTIGVGATASFSGAGIVHIDGGAGTDILSLIGAGNTAFSTIGVERLSVQAGTGNTRTIEENGSFNEVTIISGTLSARRAQALGVATSLVTVGGGAVLSLDFTAPAVVNNSFAGSGTVRQNTIDPVTYGGSSAGFTGIVEIGGGVATITSSDAFGSAQIFNNSDIQFDAITLGNNITGAGTITKIGSGTGIMTGNNTYTGGTLVTDGTLQINNGSALGSGTVTLSSGTALLLDMATNQTLANNIIGFGNVIKSGAGTVDITGNNAYFGNTSLQGGAIRVDDLARLGLGTVFSTAGTSLILNYNGAAPLVQTSSFMTGDGQFVKEGAGEILVDVANSYTGGTRIVGGVLRAGANGAFGSGTVQIDNGGTLALGSAFFSPTINNDLTGNGTVIIDVVTGAELGGNNLGFTGLIDIAASGSYLYTANGASLGSGTVNIGAGTLLQIDTATNSTVVANLTGSGNIEKDLAGTLTLAGNGSMTGGTVTVYDGTLRLSGTNNLGVGPVINLSAATSVLDLNTNGASTLSNAVTGVGRLIKTGTGTVDVTGSNTYSGGTDIQQGALRVTDVNFLGTGAVTVQSGAALDLSIAGAATFNGAISGAGILRKSNTGDLTLINNTLTGGLDIVGGRVIVSSSAALGGGAVTTAAGTRLVFNNSTTEVITNVISGDGGLTKDGTGTLALNNANSYTGGTQILAGRIVANDSAAFGTGTVTISGGAEIGIGGVTIANTIAGAGRVVKTANNIGVLTGNNAYSGGTDIQQGGLLVNNPASLGTGAVSLSGANTTLEVNYGGAGSVTLSNQIAGIGTFIKSGTGTVVMNAMGNSYSGGTLINAGRLGLNFSDSLGTGLVQINTGAELAIGDFNLANNVQGGGRILKTSAGSSTLSGNNTHTGGVEIQAGTLNVTGNGSLGTGVVSIANGAALNYTNTTASTFSNGLSGAGTFNKFGTGLLTFGNNFTLGALSLSAGRTRINTIATTNVTVGTNATLDGTGRIIGNLTNNGIVAPGNSIGTLTVQGNYTHNSGAVLEIEFDAAGNIDLLDVTGNATLNGGIIRFVSIGGAEGQGGTFLRTGGTLTGTFASVETVGALLPLSVVYEPNRAFMAPSVLTARPSTFNAQSMAAADTALGFIDSMGVGEVRHGNGNRIWLNGFGAWGSRSASGTTLAYDHDTRGMSGGVNVDVGNSVTLGAAIGWAKGDITLGAGGGGGDQSSILGSINARYAGTGFTLAGGMVYGKIDQDTLRNVSFNGFTGSVDGSTDAKIFGAFAELGLPLGSAGGWAFNANARGSYIKHMQDGYTESGTSPLRLALGDLNTSTLEGQAKLTAKTSLWDKSNGGEESLEGLDLRVDLGGRYLGTLGDREIPVTFAVSNAGIVLQGDTRNTLQGLFGLGLDYTISSGATFSFGYKGEVGKTDRHALQAGVSFTF